MLASLSIPAGAYILVHTNEFGQIKKFLQCGQIINQHPPSIHFRSTIDLLLWWLVAPPSMSEQLFNPINLNCGAIQYFDLAIVLFHNNDALDVNSNFVVRMITPMTFTPHW